MSKAGSTVLEVAPPLALETVTGIPVADDLILPLEAAAKTHAILGIRGTGKTNTAKVMTEGFLRAGIQNIIIDPLDVWYGLKLARDGTPSGMPIIIIGGHYGDFDIEPEQGEALAKILVKKRVSAVISCSHMTKAARRSFVADLFEALYQLKNAKEYRTTMHITVDEAGMFVPQRVSQAFTRIVGATEDIVRRGRTRGLGMTLIDQRASSINKDVLTQLELLIAHKLVSPQDRDALQKWIEAFDTGDQAATFMETIGGLTRGEAWVWSPGWIEIFRRVHFRQATTYDSSSTPDASAVPVEITDEANMYGSDFMAELKDLLGAGGGAMDGEEDEGGIRPANELAAVKERVRILERQIADSGAVPVADPSLIAGQCIAGMRDAVMPEIMKIVAAVRKVEKLLLCKPGEILDRAVSESAPLEDGEEVSIEDALRALPGEKPTKPIRQRLLDLLSHFSALGLKQVDRQTAAAVIGEDPKSAIFQNAFDEMLTEKLISRVGKDQLELLDRGYEFAEASEPPETLADLQERWILALGDISGQILKALIEAYPEAVSRPDLAAAIGQRSTSSAFNLKLGMLKLLNLVAYPEKGYVTPSDALYPASLEE